MRTQANLLAEICVAPYAGKKERKKCTTGAPSLKHYIRQYGTNILKSTSSQGADRVPSARRSIESPPRITHSLVRHFGRGRSLRVHPP